MDFESNDVVIAQGALRNLRSAMVPPSSQCSSRPQGSCRQVPPSRRRDNLDAMDRQRQSTQAGQGWFFFALGALRLAAGAGRRTPAARLPGRLL